MGSHGTGWISMLPTKLTRFRRTLHLAASVSFALRLWSRCGYGFLGALAYRAVDVVNGQAQMIELELCDGIGYLPSRVQHSQILFNSSRMSTA